MRCVRDFAAARAWCPLCDISRGAPANGATLVTEPLPLPSLLGCYTAPKLNHAHPPSRPAPLTPSPTHQHGVAQEVEGQTRPPQRRRDGLKVGPRKQRVQQLRRHRADQRAAAAARYAVNLGLGAADIRDRGRGEPARPRQRLRRNEHRHRRPAAGGAARRVVLGRGGGNGALQLALVDGAHARHEDQQLPRIQKRRQLAERARHKRPADADDDDVSARHGRRRVGCCAAGHAPADLASECSGRGVAERDGAAVGVEGCLQRRREGREFRREEEGDAVARGAQDAGGGLGCEGVARCVRAWVRRGRLWGAAQHVRTVQKRAAGRGRRCLNAECRAVQAQAGAR